MIVKPIIGYELGDWFGGDQDGWELRCGAVFDESFEGFDAGAAKTGTAKDDAVGWHLFVWLEVLKTLEAASWIGRDQNLVTDLFQSVAE